MRLVKINDEQRAMLQLCHIEHIRRWTDELDEAIRSGNAATRKMYVSGLITELKLIESLEDNPKVLEEKCNRGEE